MFLLLLYRCFLPLSAPKLTFHVSFGHCSCCFYFNVFTYIGSNKFISLFCCSANVSICASLSSLSFSYDTDCAYLVLFTVRVSPLATPSTLIALTATLTPPPELDFPFFFRYRAAGVSPLMISPYGAFTPSATTVVVGLIAYLRHWRWLFVVWSYLTICYLCSTIQRCWTVAPASRLITVLGYGASVIFLNCTRPTLILAWGDSVYLLRQNHH